MHEPPPHPQQQPYALPAPPAAGHYAPRRALWDTLWDNKAVRIGAVFLLLALCGLIILALVREQTGTEGFLVGLGLAVLPVPLLIAAFRWMDRVEPKPWKSLIFAFAWGACAATLVAILANGYATKWLLTTVAGAQREDAAGWGATFVAPVVEESAKAAAILLLYLFRRRDFNGIVDGVVVAGITATGFAFTENILYLGNAFANDQSFGYEGLRSTTAATFFVRVLMSPFAHPLFTSMTGLGFGLAATLPQHRRLLRWLVPVGALLTAMLLHGLWNGSATLPGAGFLAVYALFMVPVFALLTWLTLWSRQNELRTIQTHLPAYQSAGWLTPPEPHALSSMRARGIARDLARRHGGPTAARIVAEYISYATSLAFLRHRALRGTPDPAFGAREAELLHHLWQRREVAQPALASAVAGVASARPPFAAGAGSPYGTPPQGWAPPVPGGPAQGWGAPTPPATSPAWGQGPGQHR
ncbi:PrsW family glutamic-type intramembrane protease [Streptomyces sp. NPDC000405]|uniref:PrsW family glutamic-type intramembrane protease n=1 Tax=Streptomyces sp. NPDC000405 TaxID=3161033 RepID=UPI00398CA5C6